MLSLKFFLIEFSYFIDKDVCYLTMCEQQFSKRTAFSYLEDLAAQFYAEYGTKINTVARPYSFIEFGNYYFYFWVNPAIHMAFF
jgi:hypothetical protein